jgi:hypothetical protein
VTVKSPFKNHSIYRKKLMNFFFPTGEKIVQYLANRR